MSNACSPSRQLPVARNDLERLFVSSPNSPPVWPLQPARDEAGAQYEEYDGREQPTNPSKRRHRASPHRYGRRRGTHHDRSSVVLSHTAACVEDVWKSVLRRNGQVGDNVKFLYSNQFLFLLASKVIVCCIKVPPPPHTHMISLVLPRNKRH